MFYKKQVQIIFEERYPHDITGKAVNSLLEEGLLGKHDTTFNQTVPIIFVYNKRKRSVIYEIKHKIAIIERFTSDESNDGCGKQGESLFKHMFEKNQFKIVGEHTNSFRGKQWTVSDKNLDFIIEKEGRIYGIEIKNTFDYMPQAEFDEKIRLCDFLGIIPLFPVRYASPSQHLRMAEINGLALVSKTRFFPPGNQTLVTDIWNNFRLPVNVWTSIPPPIEHNFLSFHQRHVITNRQ